MKILVVEDEKQLRDLTARMVKSILPEVEVESVGSGEEACKELSKGDYGFFITDLGLPGMSGEEVCKKFPQTPHIAMSGEPDRLKKLLYNSGSLSSNLLGILSKPFFTKDLREVLENL